MSFILRHPIVPIVALTMAAMPARQALAADQGLACRAVLEGEPGDAPRQREGRLEGFREPLPGMRPSSALCLRSTARAADCLPALAGAGSDSTTVSGRRSTRR